jgi:hypothetical protein
VKQGRLRKLSSGLLPRYQERFFCLQGHYLKYFDDDAPRGNGPMRSWDLKGLIDLRKTVKPHCREATSDPLVFEIMLTDGIAKLKAETKVDVDEWLELIRAQKAGCLGHIDLGGLDINRDKVPAVELTLHPQDSMDTNVTPRQLEQLPTITNIVSEISASAIKPSSEEVEGSKTEPVEVEEVKVASVVEVSKQPTEFKRQPTELTDSSLSDSSSSSDSSGRSNSWSSSCDSSTSSMSPLVRGSQNESDATTRSSVGVNPMIAPAITELAVEGDRDTETERSADEAAEAERSKDLHRQMRSYSKANSIKKMSGGRKKSSSAA